MKELRVKGDYEHHKGIKAAHGIKITAQGLEHAIAGNSLHVVGPDDDIDVIKELAMEDMESVLSRIDKSGEGVYVQASTLGSLEALLEYLKSPDLKIPVNGIGIGPVHKKDIMKAGVMLERKKEYATILAFDMKVTKVYAFGILKIGTPICVPSREFTDIGRIASIENNRTPVDYAKKGNEVSIKIVTSNREEQKKTFGRHFDEEDELVSHISRRSIDILKTSYRDELSIEEWVLVAKLKKIFKIQ